MDPLFTVKGGLVEKDSLKGLLLHVGCPLKENPLD